MSFGKQQRLTKAQIRAELTPGERRAFRAVIWISFLLPIAGSVLIAIGSATRVIGVVILVLGLLVSTIPVSGIFRARVERRQAPQKW